MKEVIRYNDKQKLDAVAFCQEVKQKHQNAILHIGTDSQMYGDVIYYATVISFRYQGKGVHSAYVLNKLDSNTFQTTQKKRRRRRKKGKRKFGAYLSKSSKLDKKGLYAEVRNRLFKETEFSIEMAAYLMENGIRPNFIDLDLNECEEFVSNGVLNISKGYCSGMGIIPLTKNSNSNTPLTATYVADKIIR